MGILDHKIKGSEAGQTIAKELGKPWYKKVEVWLMIINILVLIINIGITASNSNKFSNEDVSKKVFDECFNYYASVDPEKGIDDSLIKLCKDKADNWNK